MILPHPESDLSLNIMVLGSDIIEILSRKFKSQDFVFIDNIMNEFLKKDIKRSPEHFFDALTFLYIVNVIDYKGHKIGLVKYATQLPLF